MSRISRGCLPAGRNAVAGAALVPGPALLRQGRALAAAPSGEGEEILDLLSRTCRGYSISSSGESDVLNRMEKKVSVGLAKAGRGAAEEFLSAEIGKHDYDWLLTPPGTPLFSSVDSTDRQPPSSSQRSTSNLRSASLAKPSRLSAPQSDDRSYGPATARSSSAARASLSHSGRTPSSALNTSTASVNSRPTTPANRSRTPAAAAAAAAGPRPSTPRSATPARSRPAAAAPAAERPKSRPSTPTTRPHLPASSASTSGPNPLRPRPSSQPPTPARRPPPPPPVSTSRPSSPARSRTPAQPVLPPALDAPPSLRAKLPERPVSAGRQRRATELTARGNSSGEASGSGVSSSRRPSSPAAARGRVAENQAKGRANGLKMAENQKPVALEKKPAKPAQGGETGGYGRTLSKNSLNMAIKHMELRQGTNGMRGVSLFPHSIRSAPTATAANVKTPPASRTAPPPPSHRSRATNHPSHCITEPTPKSYNEGSSESEELQRYDSAHLKQDAGALNWLRGVDESHLFDRRFDPFPEPFILM